MGVAAYNRASKVIRESISQETAGTPAHIAYEPKPVFVEETPKVTPGSYLSLREDPRMVQVGDKVFCTVTAIRGWMTVTAVRYDHRHVDIKTDSFGRGWGYGHNFTFNPPAWMTK
jgi:hypothetical protein